MAFDVSQLVDYAWSDIAKAAKTAMMNAALGNGKLRFPDGREYERISIDDARSLYEIATAQMANEDALTAGGGNVLVRFGEAV